MGQSKKVEGLGTVSAVPLTVLGRGTAKPQYPRLAGRHLEVEVRQPLREFLDKATGVPFVLKAGDEVVGVPYEIGFAAAGPGIAFLEP